MSRLPFLVVALMSAAAVAQGEQRTAASAWFDGAGGEVPLSAKAVGYERLKPGDRSVADIIGLFADACVKAPVGRDFARPAVEARPAWGFSYLNVDSGTGGRLDGWQAADVSLTSHPRVWPLAECNVLADRKAQDDPSSVVDGLSTILGSQPDKQFKARSADGRRLLGTTVRWTVKRPSGSVGHVYASSYADINGSFALHLGLTEARPK